VSRPRVLLADDHRMVAEALKGLLEAEFELVAVVEDGHQLVEAARRLRPDVIVADITMPHLNGIDALTQRRIWRSASVMPASMIRERRSSTGESGGASAAGPALARIDASETTSRTTRSPSLSHAAAVPVAVRRWAARRSLARRCRNIATR